MNNLYAQYLQQTDSLKNLVFLVYSVYFNCIFLINFSNMNFTDLIFCATGVTSGRVKFLPAVQIFRKRHEMFSNFPKAKITVLVYITFDT